MLTDLAFYCGCALLHRSSDDHGALPDARVGSNAVRVHTNRRIEADFDRSGVPCVATLNCGGAHVDDRVGHCHHLDAGLQLNDRLEPFLGEAKCAGQRIDPLDEDLQRAQQVWPALWQPMKSHGGTPGGVRTLNLRLRRPTLYPVELRAHRSTTKYTMPPALPPSDSPDSPAGSRRRRGTSRQKRRHYLTTSAARETRPFLMSS